MKLKTLSIWAQILELIKNDLACAHFPCKKVWHWMGGWWCCNKINCLHEIGAHIYSNLACAPYPCKKVWHWMGGWMDGWVDGWMDGRAGLRIVYSNQKCYLNIAIKICYDPLRYLRHFPEVWFHCFQFCYVSHQNVQL